ncbi:CWC15 homolog A-like protein [Drosera capensis]
MRSVRSPFRTHPPVAGHVRHAAIRAADCVRDGQDTQDELQKRNLREELEEREWRHFSSKDKSYSDDRDRRKGGHLLLEGSKRDPDDRIVPRSVDADDSDVEVKSEDQSDNDDDEDDTEALLAELEQIKNERAEEKLRKERQEQEEQLKVKEVELMRGNPLLNNPTSFSVKRRWDDDVVFKNQTRGESKMPKRFINDTIRNDFHKKFLQKYMK